MLRHPGEPVMDRQSKQAAQERPFRLLAALAAGVAEAAVIRAWKLRGRRDELFSEIT